MSEMGLWSGYFLAKLFLHARGSLVLSAGWNFLLIGFLYIPLPRETRRRRPLSVLKNTLAAAAAAALLWRESWYGAFGSTNLEHIEFSLPTAGYMFQLALGQFLNAQTAAVAAILVLAFWAHRRQIRLAPFVLLPLAFIGLQHASRLGQTEMQSRLGAFFDSESRRSISFPSPAETRPDFDVVIVHVCSLSWDDMSLSGVGDDFFRRFDLVFKDFNSVTSYSGPAYIRLFRANCGQQPNSALYQDAPERCYLWDSLRGLGYRTLTGNNFGGPIEQFVHDFEIFGKADRAQDDSGLTVAEYDYDNAPLYDDYDVLMKLWKLGASAEGKPAAIYYNTVSLHDGVHPLGEAWWNKDRVPGYAERTRRLFADVDKFIDTVQGSGRSVLLVFVAEHGAALRASRFQTSGIREVPLPAITRVPVAFKFIGKAFPRTSSEPLIVSDPVSYLAISYVLSSAEKNPPFSNGTEFSGKILNDIPRTPFVSENEGVSIVENNGKYFLNGKGMQ